MSDLFYIKEIQSLFADVQLSQIFEDQKIMTDAIPKYSVAVIMSKYKNERSSTYFDLKDFVLNNFYFIGSEEKLIPEKSLEIETYIDSLWDVFTKKAEDNSGTLLKLPKPYIVPGGRFNEFFYWDSYFVMLGLQVSGKIQMMKNIVENCAYLINKFGFVPNASRTHFLTRSQPPFFSVMLDLLVGSTKDESFYDQYFGILEKEYNFWMNGSEKLSNGETLNRVYKTKEGYFLNRYYDSENEPRPESYLIDIEEQRKSTDPEFYRNIRAACESGWDFSSRWFSDNEDLRTINTLNILPVDLNCLLWHMENTLSKTAAVLKQDKKSDFYRDRVESRKNLINKYFWNEDKMLYQDFDIETNSQSISENISTLYPMFFGLSDLDQANAISKTISEKFLFDGGLVTTTKNSGQQWDYPNAWAPFQWIGFEAMKNYGFHSLAEKIRSNWCSNVERVYEETGRIMEKYNAIDKQLVAGGGEYPNQDGFGWTNGVYIKLKKS